MNKTNQFYRKKTLSYLVVILLLGNFIYFSVSLSYLSEESLNSDQNSQDEFNFYKGVNCTKLGEYDSNYGNPYEIFIAEHFSRTLAFIRESYGILVVDISDPVLLIGKGKNIQIQQGHIKEVKRVNDIIVLREIPMDQFGQGSEVSGNPACFNN